MLFHIPDYVIVVTSYKIRSYNPGNPGNPGNLRFPRTPLPFTGNLLQEPTVPRTPLPLQEQ